MSSVPGVARPLGAEFKVIGLVGVAHLMSHFFALAVPPVFYLLKEDFGVSYAAMGFAMSMFFVGSGLLQTPAGFLVDRLGGKAVLATGLAVESFGIMLVGLAPSYALLAVALGIAGLGNSVFHPADMSILNAKVDKRRLGYAFSVHSVSGNLGWVLAPLFSVGLATAFGWRSAMFAAGAIGLAIALLLATQPLLRHEPRATARRDRQRSTLREDLKLLVSAPVLSCFSFFVFTSVNTTAMQSFSIPAIVSLYGVPLATAAGTLTGYLVGAAGGTLVGGFVAARSRRHGLAAGAGLGFAMLFVATLASGALPALLLVATTTLAGFSLGTVNPSRDIIVREVTPEHARGKVYGFVYSGLDLGSSIAPPVIGWLIDTGRPRMVFLVGAAALLMSATLMLLLGRRRR